MRVLLLADVHGNWAALEAIRERFDVCLVLGDLVDYGPEPGPCVEWARRNARVAVRGNHDHAIATGRLDVGMNSLARKCAAWTRDALGGAHLAWLMGLAIEQSVPGEAWMAVHGAPRDPHRFLAYVYELTYEDNLKHLLDAERPPLCFCGHTHVQIAHLETAGGPTKVSGEAAVIDLEGTRAAIEPSSPRPGIRPRVFTVAVLSATRVPSRLAR